MRCEECDRRFPVRAGTLRAIGSPGDLSAPSTRARTARSFAFEWQRFGRVRREWERNFLDYVQPHPPSFFAGLRVLDAGTGSGRHARQAAIYGAQVAAIDLGDSIDVARRNLPDDALTVQADVERPPFRPASFDFVMSIGVLHHLPDPERALRRLAELVKPGGRLRVYLYWRPDRAWQRAVLRGVGAVRTVTTRLPHRLLEALCYPLAALLWVAVVMPHRAARRWPRLAGATDSLPLKTYADYPFGVLVNDQFDRFSAPIERRHARGEVEDLMAGAGLEDVFVLANAGWVGEGRKPACAG